MEKMECMEELEIEEKVIIECQIKRDEGFMKLTDSVKKSGFLQNALLKC
jgi:hypothetical protein